MGQFILRIWAWIKECDAVWSVLDWFDWRKTVIASIILAVDGLSSLSYDEVRWYHFIGFVISTSFILLGLVHFFVKRPINVLLKRHSIGKVDPVADHLGKLTREFERGRRKASFQRQIDAILKRRRLQEDAGFITMKDAAVRFYGEARTSKFIMAQAAEEMSGANITNGSPDDILDYMATYMAKKIPIYGRKDPSQHREKISSESLKLYAFKGGATRLEHLFYPTSDSFSDLEVTLEQFEALLAEMHLGSGFHDSRSSD